MKDFSYEQWIILLWISDKNRDLKGIDNWKVIAYFITGFYEWRNMSYMNTASFFVG